MTFKIIRSLLSNRKLKNNNINGTWKISGHFLDHDGYDFINKKFNFIDFNYTFTIDQDSEKTEFFIVQSNFNENSSTTKGASFQPGIIINNSPLTINISDYNDDGIFRLREKERDSNNLVISFTGYYIESGFSKDNIYQRPNVGSFTMKKQSNENNITKLSSSSSPSQSIVQKLTLAENQLWYSLYNLHEIIMEKNNNYIINLVGPLLNSNNEIIGFVKSENTYSIDKGITYCNANVVYNIYNIIHDDDYKNYGKDKKYVAPNNINIKGSLGINIQYQGTLSNSKFLSGTINTNLSKREGENLPQTDEPVSLILKGRPDGARVVTCDDLIHI